MKHLLLGVAFALAAALPVRAATDIVEVTSPGGLKAWLVEEHSIPIIALQVTFRGGTSIDLPGKEGATNLMMGLLEEGAGEMDATQFLEATEALAAHFSYRAWRDTTSIDAEMLSENADEVIDLLRLALVEPRFSQVAVDRVRGQVISSLTSDATDPDTIASQTLRALSFPDHPYSAPSDGTIASVTALTREDIMTAHKNALVKSRAHIGVVGDITPEELGLMLDRLLGDLAADGPPLPPKAEVAVKGGTTVVPFDTPQSVAVFGHRGIDRDAPEYLAAYVLNEVLGGNGIESRLMREVREKRGLTYGVYTYLASFESAAQILGNVASANDRMAETLDVIRTEWSRMYEEGISEDELNSAKLYLTGAYPLRFDGNSKIAGVLVGMQLVGLPIDYVYGRNALIDAITLDEVNAVARQLLAPDALHVVVVGQPVGVEATDLPN